MAEIEETDSPSASLPNETPPPIPPRPHSHASPVHRHVLPQQEVYQWVSVREKVTRGSRLYYQHVLDKLSHDLIAMHTKVILHVQEGVLELKPTHEAASVTNWEDKVCGILSKYKQDFKQAEMRVTPEVQNKVKGFLHDHQKQFPDFDYDFQDDLLKVSGSTASVDEAMQNIDNIVKEDMEISIEIQNSPRNIEYLLKFAQDEISNVDPPVNITRDAHDPTLIKVTGNNASIKKVQQIAHEKLAQVHSEIILLTNKAHRLLSSKEGRARIEKAIEKSLPKLVYVFENADDETYTHRICILSPDQPSCSLAKRKLDDLFKVKNIPLSFEKSSITASQEWRDFCGRLSSDYFVHVSSNDNEVIVTGDSSKMSEICDEIDHFLNVQDNVTEEISVKSASLRLVREHLSAKLGAVQKYAHTFKVDIDLPSANSADANQTITLKGNIKAVGDIRGQLSMLMSEVLTHSFQVQFQPGMQQVLDKGEVRTKLRDFEHKHKVVIEYDVEEVIPAKSYSRQSTRNALSGNPYKLIKSTTPNGISVSVFSGDYSLANTDVLVTFVPSVPDLQAPVFVSLVQTGGQQLLGELETALKRRELIEATVHHTMSTGDLKCSALMHVVIPPYSQAGANHMLETALDTVFQQSTTNMYSSIAISPFTSHPLNYPVEVYAHSLIAALDRSRFGIYNDINVSIFIDEMSSQKIFEDEMKEAKWHVHHVSQNGLRLHATSFSHSSMEPVRGNADTLKNFVKIVKGSILDIDVSFCNIFLLYI